MDQSINSNNTSLNHDLSNYTSLEHSPIDPSNNISLSHTSSDLSDLSPVCKKVQAQELTSLSNPTQNMLKQKVKKCNKCKKKRKLVNETHQICHPCYKIKTCKLSGNKVIDDFIKSILSSCHLKAILEFIPYDRFENIKFVAEGGFSKIYKATWIDGPVG
jgi:hypothetical protein